MPTPEQLIAQLGDGTVLEGPHWTEPVRVMAATALGGQIRVRAVGLHTRRLWDKLLKPEDFDGKVTITAAGELAALDGDPTRFRLAAEAHRIRLAFQ